MEKLNGKAAPVQIERESGTRSNTHISKATEKAEEAKSTASALSKAFKAAQKPRQGQNKQIHSLCLSKGLQGVSKATKRTEQDLNAGLPCG